MKRQFEIVCGIGLVALLSLNSACTKAPGVVSESHDFFATVAPLDWVRPANLELNDATLSACEANLNQAVCETDASTGEIQGDLTSIPCTANSKQYVPAVMKIVSEMPERLRPSICSVYRIFISDNISSTAFASPILSASDGSVQGAYIGSRKSTFLRQPSIGELATWKEQLAFGGSQQFLNNDPNLVQIDYGLKTSLVDKDGLFYVLVHELGHLIDFQNSVNRTDCGGPLQSRGSECVPLANSWGALSWAKSSTPLAGFEYYLRDSFCFYGCTGHLDPKTAPSIYSSMRQSAFITSYSGVNPLEDFAEFWAWYVMIRNKNPHFIITVPGQTTLDMNAAFTQNPKILRKLEFIDHLWNSPDLKIRN